MPFLTLWIPLDNFCARLGALGSKKGVPKAFEGDLVDIVKTYVLIKFELVFGASGRPVGVQKLS